MTPNSLASTLEVSASVLRPSMSHATTLVWFNPGLTTQVLTRCDGLIEFGTTGQELHTLTVKEAVELAEGLLSAAVFQDSERRELVGLDGSETA